MVNCQGKLLRHAEYRAAEHRLNNNVGEFRAWSEAVIILQGVRSVSQPAHLAKYQNVKDKWERRFSAKVFNDLAKVMHGSKEGRDLSMTPLPLNDAPEIMPVDKLYAGSARSALLIGLMPFSETKPATKEELVVQALQYAREDLDSARDIKYGGWPEMNMIVRMGLAVKKGKYYKKREETYTFWLTALGRLLADEMKAVMRIGEATPKKRRPAEQHTDGSAQKVPRQGRQHLPTGSPYLLPTGSSVSVHGLMQAPELNGKVGKVLAWDPERGRYEIEFESGRKSLRPSNVTGRCQVRIVGVVKRPELNGSCGQVLEFDLSVGRYRVDCGTKGVVKLQPSNIVFPDKTPVVLMSPLASHAANDTLARVLCYDADDCTYMVETAGGKLLEAKSGEIVC